MFTVRNSSLFYPVLIFTLICCGKDTSVLPKPKCLLSKIVVKSTSSTTETTYTYDSNGRMLTQTRVRNGAVVFDYDYLYNTEGKVDRVNDVSSYSQYKYGSNGKIETITVFEIGGRESGQFSYNWANSLVTITYSRPEKPNPVQINTVQFLGENVIVDKFESFTGGTPNELISVAEISYENFDSSLSPFFVASPSRPGFDSKLSKNNPRKVTEVTKNYDKGVITQQMINITNYEYSYSAFDAMVTSKASLNGTTVDTTISYQGCN